MILGFTGTREGMTNVQRESVAEFLRQRRPTEAHHGDCVGADSEFHDAALLFDPNSPPHISSHPCNLKKYRAYRHANSQHPVKSPKERNWDIARASDHLLAAPRLTQSEPRSGTWQTIRFMLSLRKPVTVVWPDGTTQEWGFTSLAEILESVSLPSQQKGA